MRHLACFAALVLFVACHSADPDAAPAADGNAPQGFAGSSGAAGSGDAGSGGQSTAGAAGQGSTETGGAAGHFCQGAGGFPDADIVQGTNEACGLLATGACSAQTAMACCPVKGAHYRWNTTKKCRTALPIGGEVATCALMDFAPPPGDLDPCSYSPAPSCFRLNGTNNVEILVSPDYWRPAQIGANWEICTDDFQSQINEAADCP